MKITLIGSARYEKKFKELNKQLTLAGHVVYSLAVYPSDEGEKDWYTPEQKEMLDEVHLAKIDNSDAVYVICEDGELGESTTREVLYAERIGIAILCPWDRGTFSYKMSVDGNKAPVYGIIKREDGLPLRFTKTCGCGDPALVAGHALPHG